MSSYLEQIRRRISELERSINLGVKEKELLEDELAKLKMQEFEEDIREENEVTLLKG